MLAIVVLAVIAVVAAALDPPPPPLSGRARASDGDSLRIGDDRIRLVGLDAPELAQACTDLAGRAWPCGRVARDRMAALLAGGEVDCRPEDVDQYHRLLATCSTTSGDLGAIMVAEGLAVSSGRYWSEETAARRDRRGIWAGDFEAPRRWRDDNPQPRGPRFWLGLLGL